MKLDNTDCLSAAFGLSFFCTNSSPSEISCLCSILQFMFAWVNKLIHLDNLCSKSFEVTLDFPRYVQKCYFKLDYVYHYLKLAIKKKKKSKNILLKVTTSLKIQSSVPSITTQLLALSSFYMYLYCCYCNPVLLCCISSVSRKSI